MAGQFGTALRSCLAFVLGALVVLPISAAEFPTHGPLSAVQIRMEIEGMGGVSKHVELSGDGGGTYRLRTGIFSGTERDTTLAFSYKPQELLDLVNDVFARHFIDLPARIYGRTNFESSADGAYTARKAVWMDVGSSTITIRIGDYVKSVE